jgi:hypothetical protein
VELVGALNPGLVSRFQAIQLLVTWDVLVRSVCRELADRPGPLTPGDRAWAALRLLAQWKASQGLVASKPISEFPDDCAEFYGQVQAGERVCGDFTRLVSADTQSDVRNDFVYIDEALSAYWEKYPSPLFPPDVGL